MVVEATLEKLIEKRWLDDLDFARQWIENRNTFRPRSNRLLAYELRLKGVADDKHNPSARRILRVTNTAWPTRLASKSTTMPPRSQT
jgi:SOS response regulatory protein OraA/RecX